MTLPTYQRLALEMVARSSARGEPVRMPHPEWERPLGELEQMGLVVHCRAADLGRSDAGTWPYELTCSGWWVPAALAARLERCAGMAANVSDRDPDAALHRAQAARLREAAARLRAEHAAAAAE